MIDYIKKSPLLFILILIAFVSYMITIIPSGSEFCFQNSCGLFFWGAHGHDAIWHLAIVSTAFKSFPFVAPTFAGAQLSGYNFFLDIVIFLFTRIGIPAVITYFKILPLIWFVLFTGLIIKLGRKLHESSLFVGILLLFMYFSGSFSYLITLMKDKTLVNSGALLAMQSMLSLTNVQFACSLCILLYILLMVKDNKSDIRSSTLLSVLVGLNVALKFYGGIISFFLVFCYFISLYLVNFRVGGTFLESTRKLVIRLLLLGFFSLMAIVLFYNPFAPTTGGAIMTFKPLATVHPIIEDPSLLYNKDLVNARYFLENSGKFSPRLVWIEIQTLLLFLFLNFGTRIIGLLYLVKIIYKKQFTTYYFLLTTTIIFAMCLNIFFVQKGQWWNTVQFSYYAFFLANIFAALALYEFWQFAKKHHPRGAIIIISIIVLLTLPSSIDTLRTFTQFPAHSYIPNQEMAALTFLKNQPNGIVFTPLPNKNRPPVAAPAPLSAMNDSAYIAAFTGKQMYVADEVQLQLTGVDYEKRAKMSMDWNCTINDHVDYLYEVRSNPIEKKLDECKTSLRQIYKNTEVTIYTVNQGRLLTR